MKFTRNWKLAVSFLYAELFKIVHACVYHINVFLPFLHNRARISLIRVRKLKLQYGQLGNYNMDSRYL